MNSYCWKCSKEVELPITFKQTCEHCLAYLHCCLGCRFYQPGKPNDCTIAGTEQISDREAANYCEEFKPRLDQEKKNSPSIEDITKQLFKD